LFEASDEASYVLSVKREVDLQFEQINKKSYYLIKKGLRRILLNIRKYIRYSRKKETEIDLLIYFCVKLKKFTPFVQKNSRLRNLYDGQIETIRKKVLSLHEDLQFDYETELDIMNN
jgi:hypothetical protein